MKKLGRPHLKAPLTMFPGAETNTRYPQELVKSRAETKTSSEVTYQMIVEDQKICIYNVSLNCDDWNVAQAKESTWGTRIIVCKVDKREERLLYLSPGDVKIDLNKISIDFLPVTGDWLELDVKHEVNELAIDLSGNILEVNRISPVRAHMEKATVTSWDPTTSSGILTRRIFFNRDSLSCGYVPVVGDKVVAEVIESAQDECIWRASKLIPEYVSKRLDKIDSDSWKIEKTHPDIEIDDVSLNFSRLNVSERFKVRLINNATLTLTLIGGEFSNAKGQCKILSGFPPDVDILPRESYELECECKARNMGKSNEFLVIYFKDFQVSKWVEINVEPDKTLDNGYYQNRSQNFRNNYNSNNQFIRGQRNSTVRFKAVRVPDYPVSKKLLDLVVRCRDLHDKIGLVEELKATKRSLFSDLTPINYEDKFHGLLHLDEIENLICIRNYDRDLACFIRNGEYLMLEIENLSEKRPSIVLGDRIIASDPLRQSKEDYEGNVFKVGARHVYLKFSALFHESYNGEDYSVRVVPGRSAYRRQHHAVFLVARNLGKEWLFPSKVVEKDFQVRFAYKRYSRVVQSVRRLGPKELYQIVAEENRQKRLQNSLGEEEEGNDGCDLPKLEWFNPHLNSKQKDAVINILKGVARPLPYIIFGPPGTGKTVTVIESILQLIRFVPEARLLVTAPSNSAADLIALRLIDSGILKPGNLVRLVSVNYATGDSIPARLVPYCATASYAKEGTADVNNVMENGMICDCSRAVLGRHKITVSTCSSAGALYAMGFPRGHFTHIVVDEAGQAAEPEVMIPLSFLDKWNGQVILAGDPMQLGPVVLSKIAEECGLGESFLERLTNRFPYARDAEGFPDSGGYDPRLVTKLLYNYRSLEVILELFSSIFYHGELIPTVSDKHSDEAKLLASLREILPEREDEAVPALVFHGVDGENYQTADSPSWYNPHEVAQVFYYVNELYRLGCEPAQLGVITPYTKQVKEIKSVLKEAEFTLPKVGTVEDFQGQEFDVVILSTVRSSRDYVASDVEHSLGFVSSPRRLNVAISRSKALLVIVGNPNLLCYDTYWRTVIAHCVSLGAYTGCDLNVT
ncbi:probable RNA helicase armi isoform X2 [Cylas formicarius]|uniref:probable RNA helicase armi isoform X2 n=1 Tax=Cylas formicarius TaxID=197179 RepID=UPI0029584022|nr:probable RNA helicase armi isoform X2 [Cylas formicarius]